MIVSVTFKTPDAVSDAVCAAYDGKFSDQLDYEEKVGEAENVLEKWVQYGEYVTIDFDLVAKTATVQELSS